MPKSEPHLLTLVRKYPFAAGGLLSGLLFLTLFGLTEWSGYKDRQRLEEKIDNLTYQLRQVQHTVNLTKINVDYMPRRY